MSEPIMNEITMNEMPSRAQLDAALVKVKQKLTAGLWTTHSSYAILLLLISWLNFQSPDNGIKLLLIKTIPLLIFIPGFIKQHHRTYSWLCFAILPYFIWIVPLVMGRGALTDWIITILIIINFIAAMMTSRWLQQDSHLTWQIQNTPVNQTTPAN